MGDNTLYQKLGHALPEVRQRAVFNLAFKVQHGLVAAEEVQVRPGHLGLVQDLKLPASGCRCLAPTSGLLIVERAVLVLLQIMMPSPVACLLICLIRIVYNNVSLHGAMAVSCCQAVMLC